MDESVVKVFEEQKVGKLKLSAAIRIGSRIRPQCDRIYFDRSDRFLANSPIGSCALGAAWEGAGYGRPNHDEPKGYEDLCQAFRIPLALAETIARLNDRGETREQIADWLEAQDY